jgi:predicted amidohydrolase YtcJ
MFADKILLSDAVFTGNSSKPFPGAVVIQGEKIVTVCKKEEIEQYIGENTQVYSYGDNLIMPGFCEAHGHLNMGALYRSRYFLSDILNSHSEEECAQMVKAFAEAHPDYERIIGQGWYPVNWNDAPLPTKYSLDAVVPDRPVYLAAADVHTCWMNSKALAESKVDKDDPVLGKFVGRLLNGELSGIISEGAWFRWACNKVLMPDPTIDEEVDEDLVKELSTVGITTFCDCSGIITGTNYDALERMEKKGNLTVRVNLNPSIEEDEEQKNIKREKERYHSGMLMVTGAKGIMDGVTTTYTGYLLEPYSDHPETKGFPVNPPEYYEKCIIAANRHGFGVRVHCIGDAAVRLALDCFEKSNKVNDNQKVRNSIEHIESIHPDDIPRFGKLGVVASMQPRHLPLDANEKIGRIGKERSRYEWPNRSILNTGGVLAFGTDYPVVDFNPFESIYYAVTRNGYDHKPTGVNPWEKVTLAEALRAYTFGGAYVSNRDKELGTLEAGKLADVIVLDRNLFKTDTENISDCKVILTVCDGNVVFEQGAKMR